MDKTKRLRNCAEGFMAGLVMAGFAGPWRWAHHQWEGPFLRVWRPWQPPHIEPGMFPTFEVGGGSGRSSQPRDMLWQLKRGSPFHDYRSEPLNREPHGLTAAEYADIWVKGGASAAQWRDLAAGFLAEMAPRERSRSGADPTEPGLTPQ